MGPRYLILLLALLVACHISAATPEANLTCQCPEKTLTFVSPRRIKTVTVAPAGNNCPKTEIIVELQTGRRVCIDPNSKWGQRFIEIIQRRRTEMPPTSGNELKS